MKIKINLMAHMQYDLYENEVFKRNHRENKKKRGKFFETLSRSSWV